MDMDGGILVSEDKREKARFWMHIGRGVADV